MSDLQIHIITKTDSHYLDQVEVLWKDFYEGMSAQGIMLPLAEGGEKTWRKSIELSLGRIVQLLVIRKEEEVLGFALGSLRVSPEFLGSKLVGFVNGLYIKPGYRSQGLGERLYEKLEEWFRSRKVHSFELQVLYNNEGGRAFWEKAGYMNELLQMRKAFAPIGNTE